MRVPNILRFSHFKFIYFESTKTMSVAHYKQDERVDKICIRKAKNGSYESSQVPKSCSNTHELANCVMVPAYYFKSTKLIEKIYYLFFF